MYLCVLVCGTYTDLLVNVQKSHPQVQYEQFEDCCKRCQLLAEIALQTKHPACWLESYGRLLAAAARLRYIPSDAVASLMRLYVATKTALPPKPAIGGKPRKRVTKVNSRPEPCPQVQLQDLLADTQCDGDAMAELLLMELTAWGQVADNSELDRNAAQHHCSNTKELLFSKYCSVEVPARHAQALVQQASLSTLLQSDSRQAWQMRLESLTAATDMYAHLLGEGEQQLADVKIIDQAATATAMLALALANPFSERSSGYG